MFSTQRQQTVDVSVGAGGASLDFCVDTTSGHSIDLATSRPRAVSVPAQFMITGRSMLVNKQVSFCIQTLPVPSAG